MFLPHASHTPYLEDAGRFSDNHNYYWCRSAIGNVSEASRELMSWLSCKIKEQIIFRPPRDRTYRNATNLGDIWVDIIL